MKTRTLLAAFVALRAVMAVLSRSWHVPDETWQSVEVAHRLVFGAGHMTWEWQPQTALRPYLYPLMFTPGFVMLKLSGMDSQALVELLPRLTQGLVSAVGDVCAVRFCQRQYGSRTASLFIWLYASSWFVNYCSSRTLINTMEMTLTSAALRYYPLKIKTKCDPVGPHWSYVPLIALSFVLRPTTAIFWLPLVLRHVLWLWRNTGGGLGINYIFRKMIPAALAVLAMTTVIDSYFYGRIVFVPWNFFLQNVISDIGSFYGTNPWHWYVSNALPSAMSLLGVPFLGLALGRNIIRDQRSYKGRRDGDDFLLSGAVVWSLIVYSALPHKELRFILPLIPLCFCLIAEEIADYWSRRWEKILVGLWIAINVPAVIYLSLVHQSGSTAVVRSLATSSQPGADSILFLMPCHSTPWRSHLHSDVKARFLTCEPDLEGKTEGYLDEAALFDRNPEAWLQNEYNNVKEEMLPTKVVCYDVLLPKISDFLSGFRECEDIFHAHISKGRVGKRVKVFCAK